MNHTPASGDLNPESSDPGKRPPGGSDLETRERNEDRPGQPQPGKTQPDHKPGDDRPNDPATTPRDMGNDDKAR